MTDMKVIIDKYEKSVTKKYYFKNLNNTRAEINLLFFNIKEENKWQKI